MSSRGKRQEGIFGQQNFLRREAWVGVGLVKEQNAELGEKYRPSIQLVSVKEGRAKLSHRRRTNSMAVRTRCVPRCK